MLGRSPGEENGNPLQYSYLKNPMDGEAWWATVHEVAESQPQRSDFTVSTIYVIDMRRCKDWDHETSSWKHLSKDLFHQCPWSTEYLAFQPEFPSGHVAGLHLQSRGRGRCPSCCSVAGRCSGQEPFSSWHFVRWWGSCGARWWWWWWIFVKVVWEEEDASHPGEELGGRGRGWSWVKITCESPVSPLAMLVFHGPDSGFLCLLNPEAKWWQSRLKAEEDLPPHLGKLGEGGCTESQVLNLHSALVQPGPLMNRSQETRWGQKAEARPPSGAGTKIWLWASGLWCSMAFWGSSLALSFVYSSSSF